MPERISALFSNIPADRERLRLMLVDAGLFEELAKLRSDSGLRTRSRLRGMTLRPVLDPAGAAMPWFQVVVETTMPPMLLSARGRDGWFDTTEEPFSPSYSRLMLDPTADAAWTFELFGAGFWKTPLNGTQWLARRRLIVTARVYAALRPLKLRGLYWFPVRLE